MQHWLKRALRAFSLWGACMAAILVNPITALSYPAQMAPLRTDMDGCLSRMQPMPTVIDVEPSTLAAIPRKYLETIGK